MATPTTPTTTDELRRAGLREAEVRAEFDARRDRLGRVLGVMTTMQRSPETALLLHPAGAGSTARSGMILNSVVPALQAEADTLKAGLDEIATVRALETSAANTLGIVLSRSAITTRNRDHASHATNSTVLTPSTTGPSP